MARHDPISIPSLPNPLRWQGEPQSWDWADDTLTITAGKQTDWFIDPDTGQVTHTASALLMTVDEPCMLMAHVTAEHQATYDAGVLAIYQSNQVWAKLCLELSPQGKAMIVSVITRGVSDDSNAITLDTNAAFLRVAKLDKAYAFHYSVDGEYSHLIRYFSLGESENVQLGFLAQSPMGESCKAYFQHIVYTAGKLGDIRSGI